MRREFRKVKTQDFIIVIILLIILIPALKSTLSHMKGEGSCCGGSKEKTAKKKLPGKPKKIYTINIEGMHCTNCKNRVEKHLNDIADVVAKVNLLKNNALVRVYGDTSEDQLKHIIEQLDFKVKDIQQ